MAGGTEGLDIFGLGQAMIDFGAVVSDDCLELFNVEKGSRRLISEQELHQIQQKLNRDLHLQAGGSISNTLMALAALAKSDNKPMKLGFAGCIGSDVLGVFYKTELAGRSIHSLPNKHNGEEEEEEGETSQSLTGCVVVLTTSDAQRSFLVYPGNSTFVISEEMKSAISKSNVLLIEGYLIGLPNTLLQIQEAVRIAKLNGTLVVLTGGDAQVIKSALDSFWKVINQGVDMFLCNHAESVALLNKDRSALTAKEAVKELSKNFLITAVTDGPNGSFLAGNNHIHWIEAFPCEGRPPVDTCGAGDVYAAGLLYGFLHGFDICKMGLIASRSALSIVRKTGAQLNLEEAREIIHDIKKTNHKVNSKAVYVKLSEGVRQKA
eukprot:g4601.t1